MKKTLLWSQQLIFFKPFMTKLTEAIRFVSVVLWNGSGEQNYTGEFINYAFVAAGAFVFP